MNDRVNIEAVITKFYEIISGTKSEPRDWSAFRELFVTDAQIWLLGSNRDIGEAAGEFLIVSLDFVLRLPCTLS